MKKTIRIILVTFSIVAIYIIGMQLKSLVGFHGQPDLSKVYLDFLRADLNRYYETYSRYPDNLTKLEYTKIQYREFISAPIKGNRILSKKLNGKGGWFYNSLTGNVKINITEPIRQYYEKNYWFPYLGSFGSEIPSEW